MPHFIRRTSDQLPPRVKYFTYWFPNEGNFELHLLTFMNTWIYTHTHWILVPTSATYKQLWTTGTMVWMNVHRHAKFNWSHLVRSGKRSYIQFDRGEGSQRKTWTTNKETLVVTTCTLISWLCGPTSIVRRVWGVREVAGFTRRGRYRREIRYPDKDNQ